MTLLVPDENISFEKGPSYILAFLACALFVYLCFLVYWFSNSLRYKTILRKNMLHRTLTVVFVLNIIIQSFGLGIVMWIETERDAESFIWGLTALDAYTLLKLFLNTSLFIILILISRGWCITKESDALNHLDRQLLFLQTLGITFANVLATNYINKIAIVSLILIYSIVFRVLILSVNQLLNSLRIEIRDLETLQRPIPISIIDSIKKREKTLSIFKSFLAAYYVLLIISRSFTFYLAPLWLAFSDIVLAVFLIGILTTLFSKTPIPTLHVRLVNGQIEFSVQQENAPVQNDTNQILSEYDTNRILAFSERKYFVIQQPAKSEFDLPIMQLATLCSSSYIHD